MFASSSRVYWATAPSASRETLSQQAWWEDTSGGWAGRKEHNYLLLSSLSEAWCVKGVLVNLICRALTLGSCKGKGELWKCLRSFEFRPAGGKEAGILWVVALQEVCLDVVVYIHDEFLAQESLKLPWTWNEDSFRVLYVEFENKSVWNEINIQYYRSATFKTNYWQWNWTWMVTNWTDLFSRCNIS